MQNLVDIDVAESLYRSNLLGELEIFIIEDRGYGLFYEGVVYTEILRGPGTMEDCRQRMILQQEYLSSLRERYGTR